MVWPTKFVLRLGRANLWTNGLGADVANPAWPGGMVPSFVRTTADHGWELVVQRHLDRASNPVVDWFGRFGVGLQVGVVGSATAHVDPISVRSKARFVFVGAVAGI